MPDEVKPAAPQTSEQLAAHNAEVARKVAGQDILAQPTKTEEFGEATGALDALAAQVKPKEDGLEPKPDAGEPRPAAPKAPDAPAPKLDAPPQPTAEEVALQKRADDLFKDSPGLPPNASPKSSESFAKIKVRAAQEISAREQEITALKEQIEKAKNPSTAQIEKEKELEELRQFRQKLDVDFDPKFKEHDKAIAQHREFIYAQLLKSPNITPAVIDQIKKYGGPDMVDMSKLFESVKDPTIKRLVESKVADIEMAKYNREQAVKDAKANLTQYQQARQTELGQQEDIQYKNAVQSADKILGNLDWIAEKPITAGMEEPAKKEATEHNEFVGTLKSQMITALKDNSPEMRGILVAGMAQLFNLQRRVPSLEARLVTAEKTAAEASAKYEAIRNSSRSRLSESQAPSGGIPNLKKDTDVNQRPGDALDAIAKRISEERAAKGV
jgi:hypothetical protein